MGEGPPFSRRDVLLFHRVLVERALAVPTISTEAKRRCRAELKRLNAELADCGEDA